MTKRIYLGNLPFETTEEQVRQLCAPFGVVKGIEMITDRDSGRFRGFCFVDMEAAAATEAIASLSGAEFEGRKLRASQARGRSKPPAPKKNKKARPQAKEKAPHEQTSRGKRRSPNSKGGGQQDEIPLHERTARGGLGAFEDGATSSRGSRGGQQRRQRGQRNQNNNNSEFPFSGGSSRRNR